MSARGLPMVAMVAAAAVGLTLSLPGAGSADQAAAGKPVGLVAMLEGSASLVTGGQIRPLQLFTRLGSGDRISTGADATVVVALLSGERFRIPPGAEVELSADGTLGGSATVESLPMVATMPALGALAPGEAPGPRSGAIRVRGASLWGADVEDLYPRDGLATVADTTVLSFRTLGSTESYRVDVEDEMGEAVFSVETRSSEVVVPAGVLVPGTEYYWRVRGAGRRSVSGHGEALFVTLKAEDAAALESFRARAESEGSASVLLLLAEVDRSLGLYREACATLDRVAALPGQANPHLAAARAVFACVEYGRPQ